LAASASQHLDDRNAARHRRFKVERDAVVFRELGQGDAVLGQQRLVRRHDVFLRPQRGFDRRLGRPLVAPHDLDEHRNRRVRCQRDRIVEPAGLPEIGVARLVARARTDARNDDRAAEHPFEARSVSGKQLNETRADGAKSGDAEGQRL
jgi:hypothetical protein